MNIENNIRSRGTKEKIHRALIYLIERKNFNEIYVKDICKIACINRSSFYEYYQDINDLMIKTEQEYAKQMATFFENGPIFERENFTKMFSFVKENKEFYLAYLNNGQESFMVQNDFLSYFRSLESDIRVSNLFKKDEIIYHTAFFGAGLKALCKTWILSGLKETPEKMSEILYEEYSGKVRFFSN